MLKKLFSVGLICFNLISAEKKFFDVERIDWADEYTVCGNACLEDYCKNIAKIDNIDICVAKWNRNTTPVRYIKAEPFTRDNKKYYKCSCSYTVDGSPNIP